MKLANTIEQLLEAKKLPFPKGYSTGSYVIPRDEISKWATTPKEISDETNDFLNRMAKLLKGKGFKKTFKKASAQGRWMFDNAQTGEKLHFYGWHGKDPKFGTSVIINSIYHTDKKDKKQELDFPPLSGMKSNFATTLYFGTEKDIENGTIRVADHMIKAEFEQYKKLLKKTEKTVSNLV